MAKFEEANARKFQNIFVCKKCKSVIRATNLKVIAGKVTCRKCNTKSLRVKRKK
jgi:ribosomal protein L40E